MTELDGATTPGEPNTHPANAGEFAARWNALTPEERDQRARAIVADSETAIRCFMYRHDEIAVLTREGRANAIALGDWLSEHHPTGEPDIAKAALTALKNLTRGTE